MDRDRLRDTWRATRCALHADGAWQPLDFLPERVGLVLTAWNPGGRALTAGANAARDEALAGELRALALAPLRVRGMAPDGSWHEDGWLVAHERGRSLDLLRRWGQLAGYLFDPRGRRLLWADGAEEPL